MENSSIFTNFHLIILGIDVPAEPQRLKFIEKVPLPIVGLKQRKMPKDLRYIRGEEEERERENSHVRNKYILAFKFVYIGIL